MWGNRCDNNVLPAGTGYVDDAGPDCRARRTLAFDAVCCSDDRRGIDDGAAAVVLAARLQRDLIGPRTSGRLITVHDCASTSSSANHQAHADDKCD